VSLSIFNAFKHLTTHTSKQQRCYSFDAANLARIQEITDSNTLSHYFEADHKRLDLFAEQFSHYLMILPQLASRYFTAFAQGLTAHIVAEETVLFPFFEEKTGLQQGPTVTMRQEHQQIITILSLISEKLAQQPNIINLINYWHATTNAKKTFYILCLINTVTTKKKLSSF
jgi:hemerythrin superfamily protein